MKRVSLAKPVKNEKGVAMMMAMVTFLVLSVLVGELVYETGVYNSVVWRQVDQYRAKLLARSALRLALLQLKAAEKARVKAKSLGLGESTSLTDQIWQTPLVLPPPAPPGFSQADTQSLDEFGKKLGLDGSLSISITGENGRMNLNQLVWLKDKTTEGGAAPPTESEEERAKRLEGSRKGFVEFVDELLEQKRRSDDAFRDRYGSVRGEVLVKNILAWIDPSTQVDGDNQNKLEYYTRVEPYPYAIHNAPMASESELYMIKGFDDTLANLFADTFTTQTTGGINVNEASNNMLRALIPELGELELERIQKRKEDDTLGGKFKDAADFWNFLATLGNFEEAKTRLDGNGITILGPETSYRVVLTAKSGQATKTWTAKIGPLPPKSGEIKTPGFPAQPTQPQPAQPQNPGTQAQNSDSNSLNIIYLKAD
jgi:type II secretory pathway component PulK